MAVQNSQNFENFAFYRQGTAQFKENQTIAEDVARVADLEILTLMSQDPTTLEWVPFTDETAVDGTEKPTGIVLRTVEAADIAAGAVDNIPILVGAEILDRAQLIIENSKTLATVIGTLNLTVEAWLTAVGFKFAETDPITYPVS